MILICTATGRVGSRMIERLRAEGRANVIAGVRDPSACAALAAQGVELRKVDYDDKAVMTEAFSGVERVLFVPSFADTEQRKTQALNAIEAAQAAKVAHYVAIGIMDARPDSPLPFAHAYAAMEQRLRDSDLTWTIARTSMYTDNLAEQYPMWLKNGVIVTCAGDGKISYVSRDDIVAALTGILTSDPKRHHGKTYTLTGPRAHSYDEIRSIVSEIFGAPLDIRHVAQQDFANTLKEIWGVAYEGHDHVARVTSCFQVVFKQGMMAPCTADVEVLSGRPPETVSSWLTRHRDAQRAG